MDILDPECGLAGIYQNRPRGGAAAVEWLHGTLMTAHLGIEKLRSATMLPGTWREGGSLPGRAIEKRPSRRRAGKRKKI